MADHILLKGLTILPDQLPRKVDRPENLAPMASKEGLSMAPKPNMGNIMD